MNDFLKIIDPRTGEDFLIQTSLGNQLSLRQNNLVMLSFRPTAHQRNLTVPISLSSSEFNEFIKISMQRLGKMGFTAISPLTKEIKQSIASNFNPVDEMMGSAIGYFEPDSSIIDRQFDLRRRFASYADWCIGSCEKPFIRPTKPKWYQKSVYWDAPFLFTQVQNIGCLSVFYGETGELIFFTRIYPGIDDLLDPLRSLHQERKRGGKEKGDANLS